MIASHQLLRLEFSQNRMAADVGERQVDEVARRIHDHHVGIGADIRLTFFHQARVTLTKNGERSGLARNIEAPTAGVERQHVRPSSQGKVGRNLATGEVQHQELVVSFASDEGEIPR